MEETNILSTLVENVDFAHLTAALTTVYGGMIITGLFMLGANIIAKQLGWRK